MDQRGVLNTDRNARMRQLHAVLANYGLMAEKRGIISEFTLGRTEKASDLTDKELTELVGMLNQIVAAHTKRGRMIRSLYFHARQLGWFSSGGDGTVKVDKQRLNHWCQKHTPAHLPFDEMTDGQLAMAVTLIKKVVESDTRRIIRKTDQ